MEQRIIEVINPGPKINIVNGVATQKKRVCAYARVSTADEDQAHSYAVQVDEYTKRILANPNWEFVKIYADEGISGTDTKKRAGFNEMIRDAKNGKIDLILTKSVSRFARNTLTAIQTIRELKAINVDIFFEKENTYAMDSQAEFMLTVMASLAQEEAKNVSENVRWTFKKKMKEGQAVVNCKRFLGYDKDPATKKLVINEEEAKVVHEIFDLYTSNVGPGEICRTMEAKGYLTGAGNTKWLLTTIQGIIRNEKYVGDLLLQKTVTVDFLAHKRVSNKDIAPKYYVKDDHPAIITREQFELAQRIIAKRRESIIGASKMTEKYQARYPLSGLVICNECGRTMKRRYWNYGQESNRVVLLCGGYIEGKNNCTAKGIDYDLTMQAVDDAISSLYQKELSKTKDTRIVIDKLNSRADVYNANREVKLLEENLEEILTRLLSARTEKEKALLNAKYSEISQELQEKLNYSEKLKASSRILTSSEEKTKLIVDYLNQKKEKKGVLTGNVVSAFLYRIIAVDRENLVFCLTNDEEVDENYFIAHRNECIAKKPIDEGIVQSARRLKTYKIHWKTILM